MTKWSAVKGTPLRTKRTEPPLLLRYRLRRSTRCHWPDRRRCGRRHDRPRCPTGRQEGQHPYGDASIGKHNAARGDLVVRNVEIRDRVDIAGRQRAGDGESILAAPSLGPSMPAAPSRRSSPFMPGSELADASPVEASLKFDPADPPIAVHSSPAASPVLSEGMAKEAAPQPIRAGRIVIARQQHPARPRQPSCGSKPGDRRDRPAPGCQTHRPPRGRWVHPCSRLQRPGCQSHRGVLPAAPRAPRQASGRTACRAANQTCE